MGLMPERIVAVAQGGFYVATGVWPLVHLRSFERVTGPKAERWLVQTAGVLISAIGATLLYGARRDAAWPELRLLGVSSAVGLAGIDLVFVARGRIPPVYLLDAGAEGLLLLAWALAMRATLAPTARRAEAGANPLVGLRREQTR